MTMIEENQNAPDLEKLAVSEFVIDFEERRRLLDETQKMIQTKRDEIIQANQRKTTVANTIKAECWDTMEIVLSHIKSFNEDPLYSKNTIVSNYPLTKEDENEVALKKKLLALRKVSKILAFRQKVFFCISPRCLISRKLKTTKRR